MNLKINTSVESAISLKDAMGVRTAPAAKDLIRARENNAITCLACGHRCFIQPGREGVCRVRFNVAGELRVPFGYVGALACDPVEKKPFFHFLPGRDVLTFGMLGCDFHCGYCQNWVTSQMLRDPSAAAAPKPCTPDRLVQLALDSGAGAIASSYNEPLITSEWAHAIFTQARRAGLACAYVSNGNATPEVLDYIRPLVSAYKVDLKTFNPKHYRQLGGVMEHVTETIVMLKERGFWVEVVTLVVPGFSDDAEDLTRMADFLAGVDPIMPWHVTAFHPDYKMTEGYRATTVDDLLRVVEIGRSAGLKYVYPGNLSGRVGDGEDTRCHKCNTTMVRRRGFEVLENRLLAGGACASCGTVLPGIWE